MTYEIGKDIKSAKDRTKKPKTTFSSGNILGKMASEKLSGAKHKALEAARKKK